MNKYFLIILISISLIVYINSATCSTLTTEDKCKAESDCSWKAATCSGDNTCTNANTSEDACKAVKYGAYNCTYTPATTGDNPTPASCTGGTKCSAVTSLSDNTACVAASFAGTACTYTAAGCSDSDSGGENDVSFGLKSSALLSLALLLF